MIDIRGTNFVNKGALLMTQAIVDQFSGEFDLSMAPGPEPWSERARIGLHQTLHHHRLPRLSSAAGNRVPTPVRKRYGLVADADITGVLDASGFAYSDSFLVRRSRREALHARAWEKRGAPRVLLPQAFGPFDRPRLRVWARKAIESATRIYVRDSSSERYVRELIGDVDFVRRCPDFTIGLNADPSAVAHPSQPFAVVVPNSKLITSGKVDERAYVEVLRNYVTCAANEGLEPVVMVHEWGDASLAHAAADGVASIFTDADPLKLKAFLGSADLVVSSRFHALVGSLSQGVPTVALGWSHKYGELMADFNVPESNVDLLDRPSEAVSFALNSQNVQNLIDASKALQDQVAAMWADVGALLRAGRAA